MESSRHQSNENSWSLFFLHPGEKKVKLTLLLGLGCQDWLNIFRLYIIIPVFKTKKHTSPKLFSQNGMGFTSEDSFRNISELSKPIIPIMEIFLLSSSRVCFFWTFYLAEDTYIYLFLKKWQKYRSTLVPKQKRLAGYQLTNTLNIVTVSINLQ